MFIFLNPPKAFWAIPDTDIILSRSKPYTEITEEDLASLTKGQIDIIRTSKDNGTITGVREEIEKLSALEQTIDYTKRLMKEFYVSGTPEFLKLSRILSDLEYKQRQLKQHLDMLLKERNLFV